MARYIKKKITPNEKKKLDNLLMQLFIYDYQPFSIVEDRGFKAFVEGLNPSYQLPNRKVLSNNYLPALYETCMTKMKIKLETDAESICLTTDIWTSSVNDAYLGLTAHYIDPSFQIKSVLLDCTILPGSHTAENIKEHVLRIVENWKLKDKVLIVVTDNASNMRSAVEKMGWKHFGCYAHTLNLIVKNCTVEDTADEEVRRLINKVKNIVSHYKKSVKATEKLVSYQKQNGISAPKKVLQDVATRWNSTLKMLERFVELEDAIKATMALMDERWESLTPDEWRICRELCTVLKPFHQLTETMSGERYVSGSQILILTRGLMSALNQMLQITEDPLVEDFVDTLHEVTKRTISSLRAETGRRFANLECSKTIGITTMLDPRFKLHVFQSQIYAAEAKKSVTELVTGLIRRTEATRQPERVEEPELAEPAAKKPRFDIWGEYDIIIQAARPEGTPHSQAILEVQRYLDLPPLGRVEDPLQWWHTFQHSYPHLAVLARKKLNFLATSVPCERLFSKAGNILNERRTRLGVRKVQQLLFLNFNYMSQ
ncbi:zinc finger BED domain-containing protein 4-like [Pectinophora gossypiella]|nr:zinc finger BED domain-containing protein 4-like [Pectinophora gossypiella]